MKNSNKNIKSKRIKVIALLVLFLVIVTTIIVLNHSENTLSQFGFLKDRRLKSNTTTSVPILSLTEDIADELPKVSGGEITVKWTNQMYLYVLSSDENESGEVYEYCVDGDDRSWIDCTTDKYGNNVINITNEAYFGEGEHTIEVRKYGDETTRSDQYIFGYDNTPPTITGVSWEQTVDTITVTVEGEDDNSGIYYYSVELNDEIKEDDLPMTFGGLNPDSLYSISKLSAYDYAGNCKTLEVTDYEKLNINSVDIYTLPEEPKISFDVNGENELSRTETNKFEYITNQDYIMLYVTGGSQAGYNYYKLDDGQYYQIYDNAIYLDNVEGTYKLSVKAEGIGGDSEIVEYTIQISDETPPIINNVTYTSSTDSIKVTINAEDENEFKNYKISLYEFQNISDKVFVADYTFTDSTYEITGLNPDGMYDIQCYAYDEAGNESEAYGIDAYTKPETPEVMNEKDVKVTPGETYTYISYENNNDLCWWFVDAENSNYYKVNTNGYEKADEYGTIYIDRSEGTKTLYVKQGSQWEGGLDSEVEEYTIIFKAQTVTYNANGGSFTDGTSEQVQKISNPSNYTLSVEEPQREGYEFLGWSKEQNETNKDEIISTEELAGYKDLANESPFETTLYAQWERNQYTIKYDGNGATSGSMEDSIFTYGVYYEDIDQGGDEICLETNMYTREGYTFKGWNTKADGTGNSFINEEALDTRIDRIAQENENVITLYAQWERNQYTIKYDGNGATSGSMEDSIFTYGVYYEDIDQGGDEICLETNMYTREGYTFKGWNTKADGTGNNFMNEEALDTRIDRIAQENENVITLYAQWKKLMTVELSPDSIEIYEGKTYTLSTIITPTDAVVTNTVWTSSAEDVATVNQGIVTAIKEGTTTITATVTDEEGNTLSATCLVKVLKPTAVIPTIPVNSITLNVESLNLKEKDTGSLKVTINPSDADIESITWESDNKNIVTVQGDGINAVVTGVKEGTATITVTVRDKNNNVVTKECKITVSKLQDNTDDEDNNNNEEDKKDENTNDEEIDIDKDTNKDKNEDKEIESTKGESKDNTTANKVLPDTGITKILVTLFIVSAISIVIFIRYRSFRDIK